MRDAKSLVSDAKSAKRSVSGDVRREHFQSEDDLSPREKRDHALAVLNEMTEGNRTFSQQDQEDFDSLCAYVDNLNKDISREQIEMDGEAAETWGAKARGAERRSWFDLNTKKPVNVYAPSASLAPNNARSTNEGQSVGTLVRSMVTGRGSEADIRALGEGTGSSGGFLVPEPLSRELIDLMRAKTRVIQAGARTVDMDAETLRIAGIASDPTPGWRLEGAQIAESDPTFSQLEFRARWLGVLVRTSRELIEDSPNASEAIQQAVAGALAVEWDRAALFGSGTAPEPLGLTGTPNVFEVSMGTDGAALSGYGEVLEGVSLTTGANAERPSAMIMAPRTRYSGFGALTASDGQPLVPPEVLRDIPMLDTSGVPIDETQGASNDASRIILGDFSQMMLGIRSDVRIEVMPQVFAKTHELAIIAWMRADVQVAQPKAFAQITGITPA